MSRLTITAAIALLALTLCGCQLAYTSPTAGQGTRVDLERTDDPVRSQATRFFKNATLRHMELSPGGRWLAGVHARDGAEIIVALPLDGGELSLLGGIDNDDADAAEGPRFVTGLGWPSRDAIAVSFTRRIFSSSRYSIGRRVAVIPISAATKQGEPAPAKKTRKFVELARTVVDWLPDDPEHVIVNHYAYAKRASLETGRMQKIPGAYIPRSAFVRWFSDRAGQVRLAYTYPISDAARVRYYGRPDAEAGLESLIEFDRFDETGIRFECFSDDPNIIHVRADHEGRWALFEFDLRSKSLGRLVFSHPTRDVFGCDTSMLDDRLIGVSFVDRKAEVAWLDPEWKVVGETIDRLLPRAVNRIIGRDARDNRLLIISHTDRQPTRYYLYDREQDKLGKLFDSAEGLVPEELSRMRPVSYKARDGTTIHGFLTLPISRPARPPGGHPMIVIPHDGPAGRDVWGWNAEVQFLASRGFAVFQPNYRGSSGYGIAHERAALRQWGRLIQDDVHDGVHWLIDEGIAAPGRIGIYGQGFGGYTALMGAVKEPKLFAAAASFGGVSDIPDMLADDDHRYHRTVNDFNTPMFGSRWTERAQQVETSPARRIDEIEIPIFLAGGTDDPYPNPLQTENMALKLRAAGKPHEIVMYQYEQNGFADERNRIDFYTRLAGFFERHLKVESAGEAAP